MKKNSTNKIKRVVIKIGSSLLILKNKFNAKWFDTFVEDIVFLKKKKN